VSHSWIIKSFILIGISTKLYPPLRKTGVTLKQVCTYIHKGT